MAVDAALPAVPPRLLVIIASIRPGRAGLPISQWFVELAKGHGGFDVQVADLAEINLPMMDEPNHPRLGQYTHEHTKAWSKIVSPADAFVFVTPEYNHGYSATLKNAIDYLHAEWLYKPVGFVSYGGISAGTRAVQQLKQVVVALKMVPLFEAVAIPFFTQHLDDEGNFEPAESTERAADTMLNELMRWTTALQMMRAPAAV